jgi:hypothetical protein
MNLCQLIKKIFKSMLRSQTGHFTNAGKQMRTDAMYNKGKEFIGASILMKENNGKSYVQIHLLLQGVEIILKALLLNKDYNLYTKKLRKIGHNLTKLVKEVKKCYRVKNIDTNLQHELTSINNHYLNGNLRYGGLLDILIDVNSVNVGTIEEKTVQLIKVLEHRRNKALNKSAST